MAMLISKFHRMIQNKVIWYIICGITVVLFVLWVGNISILSTLTGYGRRQTASRGLLGGEPVSNEEFGRANASIYLVTALNLPEGMQITDEMRRRMNEAAWSRVAALREARKLGLSAGPDEIDNAIQGINIFQQQGRFQMEIYRQFVDKALPRFGFNKVAFEEHIRDEVLLRKMRELLLRTYLVSPLELQRMFGMMSDAFRIEYAVLPPTLVTNAPKVGAAEARQYFEKNAERFRLPDRARVDYVRFAVAPFVPQVKVTPEEVEAYYNDNLSEFENPEASATNAAGTNALLAAAGSNATATATDTTAAATNAVPSLYKPLETVRESIVNILRHRAATDEATKRAYEFVARIAPDRDGKALSFEEAAKLSEFGLLLEHSTPFAEYDDVPGIDAGLAFNQAAFRCTLEPDNYYSEPIAGTNFVYVLALRQKIDAHVPPFEEVEKEVLPLAERQARRDALLDVATQTREKTLAAGAASNAFATALAPYGIKPIPTDEFTAAIGPTTNDYSSILMRGILTLNQGEVSEPLPAGEELLLAQVLQRTPGDPTTFATMRGDMEQELRSRAIRPLYEQWQQQILRDGNFSSPDQELRAAEEETTEPAESAAPTNAPPPVSPA